MWAHKGRGLVTCVEEYVCGNGDEMTVGLAYIEGRSMGNTRLKKLQPLLKFLILCLKQVIKVLDMQYQTISKADNILWHPLSKLAKKLPLGFWKSEMSFRRRKSILVLLLQRILYLKRKKKAENNRTNDKKGTLMD